MPNGATAVLTTTTNSEGIFDFTAVRPDYYVLTVETQGFAKYSLGNIKIDPARTLSLPAIKLSLSTTALTVEVNAGAQAIDTSTAEVATTVSQGQIVNLPVLDRQISNLFATQAGVGTNSRTATVINGLRPSYANLTLDGVNIQDSVRTNPLDYLPNKLTIAQVAEFTVSTSNANPTIGGNAATIALVTPSGGNQLHGSGYWYNRNSFFSSNDWFNNMNGVDRPRVNLNQIGGTLGGPVKKDKLFFFTNYEAYRLKRQTPVDRTILTPTARQGILQYRVNGAVQQFDVLKAAGLSLNPFIQDLLSQLPTAANNASIGDGLNTTGYSFNARYNETRDNVTLKGDYNLSTNHVFAGSYLWNRDIVDRPTYSPFYTTMPPIYNDNVSRLGSGSWRWTPRASLTNELRGGFNLSPSTFKNRQNQPAYFITGLIFSSPVVSSEVAEGRTVDTWSLQDNANWVRGRHTLSFGYQMTLLNVDSYGYNGTIPSYGVGISAASPYGFTNQIPGASATDYSRANSLLASLAGILSTGTQTFNATSPTSGFVPGGAALNTMTYNQYALYAVDTFKLRRNVTLTLGLRWDYMAPVDETNGLAITPRLIDGNIVKTALGNASLDFTGGPSGRGFYNRDLNNLAPNIALAWDVRGDGKTSVRAGYNIAYANDNTVNSIFNVFAVNSGLSTSRGISQLSSNFANNVPAIQAPPFAIPTTTLDQFNLSPNSPGVEAMADPNLRTPYVQQWSLSLQHQVKGFIVEGRYVANHAVKILRELDFNQVQVNEPGFLQDFQRARSNMFIASAAGKGFNPNYDATLSGSQPLSFLTTLPSTALTNSTLLANIRAGEIGTYAQNMQSLFPYPRLGFSFFPNPYLLYSAVMTNISNSSYHSGQFEIRRRVAGGIQLQANYTFGKVLTDALGLRGIDAQLDNANPSIERARADFDVTHSIKLNHYIPLPFGEGRLIQFQNPILRKVTEGWGISGYLLMTSGNPVSILSARGTINRGARSGQNTVDTNKTADELKALTGVFMTGNGPYWFNPENINSNTQGVAPDGSPAFAGQVFFNPQAGSVGGLQRRTLSSSWFNNYNLAVLKQISITERHRIEIHADAYNVFNHANFYISDQNVNGNNFGRYSGQNYSSEGIGPRSLQFGLYYKF